MFHNKVIFYGEELLAPQPNPKLEDHPLSAVCYNVFNTITATTHIWRLFLHPQPKDASCSGDRNPPITVSKLPHEYNSALPAKG
jgi:hypothetical protein